MELTAAGKFMRGEGRAS